MKNSVSRVTAFAAAGLLSVILTGCSNESEGSEEGQVDSAATPIRLGLPASNYWPAYLARDEGLFETAGLDPEYISFTSGAPLIAALESESIDAVYTGLATLFAIEQDVELTYVLTPLDSSSQEGFVVPEDSTIESYEDLEPGMTVGAPTATCGHIAAVSAIRAAGLDTDDVTISNLDPSVMSGALSKREVDGTFIWGPWNIALEEEGNEIVNFDPDYQDGIGLCPTNIAVRPAYASQNPEAACKIIKGHDEAVQIGREDPQAAAATLERELGLSHEVALRTVETLDIPTVEEQLENDSSFSLVNANGGLAKQLSEASKALEDAQVFSSSFSTDDIFSIIDSGPLGDYLDDGQCNLSNE